MASSHRTHSGFSLFELTIALCIAGLFGVGALYAQGMVERATARTLAAELRGMKLMVGLYRERFRAIPGDDPRADVHLSGALPSALQQGDGRINRQSHGTWTGTAGIDPQFESGLFWQHVRMAGLAAGDPGKGHAFNAVRGRLGIGSDTAMPTRPAGTGGLHRACTSMIAGRVARLVDLELDDGVATTGRVWAAEEAGSEAVVTAQATSPYVNGQVYTVCMAL